MSATSGASLAPGTPSLPCCAASTAMGPWSVRLPLQGLGSLGGAARLRADRGDAPPPHAASPPPPPVLSLARTFGGMLASTGCHTLPASGASYLSLLLLPAWPLPLSRSGCLTQTVLIPACCMMPSSAPGCSCSDSLPSSSPPAAAASAGAPRAPRRGVTPPMPTCRGSSGRLTSAPDSTSPPPASPPYGWGDACPAPPPGCWRCLPPPRSCPLGTLCSGGRGLAGGASALLGTSASSGSGASIHSEHVSVSANMCEKSDSVTPYAAVSAAPRPCDTACDALSTEYSVAYSVASTPSGHTLAASASMGVIITSATTMIME
mmetsp:Transcript_29343/g.74768  ORF Transcript_29343/g.74768 Transcript_29343/m.74768 type:complete len:320 (-) Transcript_29343:1337-2296(-)